MKFGIFENLNLDFIYLNVILTFLKTNLKYVLLLIILCILCIFLYVRFKYQFWREQPVFHVYDISYYLFPPGIIRDSLPEKNKYCNFKNIETLIFSNIADYKINKFINFIQTHYLHNKDNIFSPKKENIVPYFTGHNSKCFFSFYNEPELLMDAKTNTYINDDKIIGVITTRPLHIFINNGINNSVFDVYYVDYLCINKNYRKIGIAPQLIQTHYYNQCLLNKKIIVSLFKREGELTGIVPLCVYSTYGFDMYNWNSQPHRLSPEYGIIEVGPKNMHHLFDFIKLNNNKFKIMIIPEIANLLELIKTSNILCYIITRDTDVICAYFFRKTCAFIRKNIEMISCFASINCSKTNDIFINGYKNAVWKISKKYSNLQFALIEDISDNNIIVKNLLNQYTPYLISPTAYFFYNFAYPTFKPNTVFLIN